MLSEIVTPGAPPVRELDSSRSRLPLPTVRSDLTVGGRPVPESIVVFMTTIHPATIRFVAAVCAQSGAESADALTVASTIDRVNRRVRIAFSEREWWRTFRKIRRLRVLRAMA
jgi:hypothetical protein